MRFDGVRFTKADGTVLPVVAKKNRGRWQYRIENSNRLLASGMTPAQFAQEFWFATLEEVNAN